VRLLDTLEQSNMLIKGHTTEDHLSADVWHLTLESLELLFDLISELSVVAEDKSGAWLGVFWELMQDGENEDCSLAHT
jgi:hypothetical protein